MNANEAYAEIDRRAQRAEDRHVTVSTEARTLRQARDIIGLIDHESEI